MDITLRTIAPEDEDFLYHVYASTRQEELAPVPWSDDQKAAFLHMQFTAQHQYYAANYPQAQFQVIVVDGQAAGRLYIDRRPREMRIVDIALLPAYRGRGAGSLLLRDIMAEGARRQLPVTIHVERCNRALRLYERLGFRMIADEGVYYLLEWSPNKKGEAD